MQFRKTQKNKKRFRGGDDGLINSVVTGIQTHASDTAAYLNTLCGAKGLECSKQFIQAANNPATLALAGISLASYAAYLLYGTRAKQDEILKKLEKVKKERRESEE